VQAHNASSAIFLRDVVWNGSLFVAVGGNLPGAGPTAWDALNAFVLTSPDGISWTVRYDNPTNPGLLAVVWNGQKFVAVGGPGAIGMGGRGVVLTSSDGLTWTEVPYGGGSVAFSDAAWDETQFEALVNGNKLLRSPDGTNWTDDGTISPGWIQSIVAAPGEVIAVGSGGRILRRACAPAEAATAPHERSSTCALGIEDSRAQVRSARSTASDPGNAPR
jgi:hypothetical protein